MTDIAIAARGITHKYGAFVAIRDVSFSVREGEFLSLVGPSGCGKSTLLRILGGFERPSAGQIIMSGRDVTDVPPERRSTNMVFQRGALFPHMTVAENIGYGLKLQRLPGPEIAARVEEMLQLIRLPGFGDRMPSALSGGQAQRVALARGLIGRPSVLLLDEPFSALDLALRKELQLELKRIHRDFRCAFIFVTHDQEEALVLSDRIALMHGGDILQDSDPVHLYTEPANVIAARFIGEMNFIDGEVAGPPHGGGVVRLGFHLADAAADKQGFKPGQPVVYSIRPEHVAIGGTGTAPIEGVVDEVIFIGSRLRVRVNCPALNSTLWAEVASSQLRGGIERGQTVGVSLDDSQARIFARSPK